jgi:hypothetical protein
MEWVLTPPSGVALVFPSGNSPLLFAGYLPPARSLDRVAPANIFSLPNHKRDRPFSGWRTTKAASRPATPNLP